MKPIATKRDIRYLSVKSTLMKQIPQFPKIVLRPLHKKFMAAGCECTLKKDKHRTILTIAYANIVQ